MKQISIPAFVGLMALLSTAVAQQTVTIVETHADSFVNAGNPLDNYADFNQLRVGGSNDSATLPPLYVSPGTRHAYMAFDVSQIPAGSTIDSVTFQAVQTDGNTLSYGFDVFEVAGAWTESTITWNNAPGSSGTALFNTGQLPSDSDGGGVYSALNQQLVGVVQGWLDNPTTNHGLIFKFGNPSYDSGDTFASRENLAPSDLIDEPYPARLTIGYTAPGDSATPWLSQVAQSSNPESLYFGSPSLVRAPNGDLLASHDYFGSAAPSGTTAIYRSTDDGQTWSQSGSDVSGAYWSNLFVHDGSVYLMGVDHSYGDVVIRRSDNNGLTWTTPSDNYSGILIDASATGTKWHCAPVTMAVKDGRIYRAFENNPTKTWPAGFEAVVMSADIDSDLLRADSWTISNKLAFDGDAWGPLIGNTSNPGWLEGNVIESPGGEIWNIIRVHAKPNVDTAAILKLDTDTMTLSFDPDDPQGGFIDFPGGGHKFTIRRDPMTGRYLSLVNNNTDPSEPWQRNVLSLISSADLIDWEIHQTLLVDDHETSWDDSIDLTGFQYVDWQFDGDDIIYLSRTSYDGAHDYHDANRMTFHRIENYISLIPEPLPGDANGDGVVDVSDLGILATNYGATSGRAWYEGDFTHDTAVDVSDLGVLAAYYGTGNTAAQSVPEPSVLAGILGLCLGGVFTLTRKRCR
ncbi:MAG: DNRLRE domain-containing protein [Pirellulales bacterium]|nr:DNRLRE domain-containing protein [Pirellulales bacterium]